MNNKKQMWTIRNVTPQRSPYLITVSRAFTNHDDMFINLDSTCETGSDEYINSDELFETEREAILGYLKILNIRKKDSHNYYNKLCNHYENLLEKLRKLS
jgi:hypothetical protein